MNPLVGIGELLWDIYPDGRKAAGGAPFNFAFHCHQLGHPGVIVSRVGRDDLGRELRERVRELGLTDEFIQTDPERATGTVRVVWGENAAPSYTISEDVAWDHLEWTDPLAELSRRSRGVAFGTLAQRSEQAAGTVNRFVQDAGLDRGGAERILDVNLRQHYFSAAVLHESLRRADVVKFAEDELRTVCEVLDWPGTTTTERVRSVFRFAAGRPRLIFVTRGPDGAVAYAYPGSEPIEMPGCHVKVVDTLGAGDAFTAAVLCLSIEGRPLVEQLRFAVHYSARVCEQVGGTPLVDRREVESAAFSRPRTHP